MINVQEDSDVMNSTGKWVAYVTCESSDLAEASDGYEINGLIREYAGGSVALVTDTGQVLRLVESTQIWKEW